MPMRRPYVLSLLGCVALVASAFLPWLRLGDVGLPGVPDPAGFFVLGLAILGVLLSGIGIVTRRGTREALLLVGLAALTTLVVVWLTGPATIADRAQARAEAIALVDNAPAQPVPMVGVGAGLVLGLAGAATIAAVGLAGAWSRSQT
jgi:hypothetical protein